LGGSYGEPLDGGHRGGLPREQEGISTSPASLSRVYPPPKGGPWALGLGANPHCRSAADDLEAGVPVVQGRQVPATQGGPMAPPRLGGEYKSRE